MEALWSLQHGDVSESQKNVAFNSTTQGEEDTQRERERKTRRKSQMFSVPILIPSSEKSCKGLKGFMLSCQQRKKSICCYRQTPLACPFSI